MYLASIPSLFSPCTSACVHSISPPIHSYTVQWGPGTMTPWSGREVWYITEFLISFCFKSTWWNDQSLNVGTWRDNYIDSCLIIYPWLVLSLSNCIWWTSNTQRDLHLAPSECQRLHWFPAGTRGDPCLQLVQDLFGAWWPKETITASNLSFLLGVSTALGTNGCWHLTHIFPHFNPMSGM